MTYQDVHLDDYERYEALYDPSWMDPHMRRKPKAGRAPKKEQPEIVAQLTDDLSDVDLGFTTTYRPSRYEQGWLLSSLYSFYNEGLITDVLSLVKGGKEASVYCCQAHPARGGGLLAAKVYRPRMFRNLRNDRLYRQGREILVGAGRAAGRDAGHIERAIRSRSAFGQQAAHTSWLMHEFTAMERLYEAGGAVPQPIAASLNAILMSYHGDEYMAAPTLNTIRLERDEAETLFREVLRNVDLMLQHGLVHGDLSAYNILYQVPEAAGPEAGGGELTVIDFPQVVNLHGNRRARTLLERDIQRTCEYFAQQGVRSNPRAIADSLWRRHVQELRPEERAADQSRLELILAEAEQE